MPHDPVFFFTPDSIGSDTSVLRSALVASNWFNDDVRAAHLEGHSTIGICIASLSHNRAPALTDFFRVYDFQQSFPTASSSHLFEKAMSSDSEEIVMSDVDNLLHKSFSHSFARHVSNSIGILVTAGDLNLGMALWTASFDCPFLALERESLFRFSDFMEKILMSKANGGSVLSCVEHAHNSALWSDGLVAFYDKSCACLGERDLASTERLSANLKICSRIVLGSMDVVKKGILYRLWPSTGEFLDDVSCGWWVLEKVCMLSVDESGASLFHPKSPGHLCFPCIEAYVPKCLVPGSLVTDGSWEIQDRMVVRTTGGERIAIIDGTHRYGGEAIGDYIEGYTSRLWKFIRGSHIRDVNFNSSQCTIGGERVCIYGSMVPYVGHIEGGLSRPDAADVSASYSLGRFFGVVASDLSATRSSNETSHPGKKVLRSIRHLSAVHGMEPFFLKMVGRATGTAMDFCFSIRTLAACSFFYGLRTDTLGSASIFRNVCYAGSLGDLGGGISQVVRAHGVLQVEQTCSHSGLSIKIDPSSLVYAVFFGSELVGCMDVSEGVGRIYHVTSVPRGGFLIGVDVGTKGWLFGQKDPLYVGVMRDGSRHLLQRGNLAKEINRSSGLYLVSRKDPLFHELRSKKKLNTSFLRKNGIAALMKGHVSSAEYERKCRLVSSFFMDSTVVDLLYDVKKSSEILVGSNPRRVNSVLLACWKCRMRAHPLASRTVQTIVGSLLGRVIKRKVREKMSKEAVSVYLDRAIADGFCDAKGLVLYPRDVYVPLLV